MQEIILSFPGDNEALKGQLAVELSDEIRSFNLELRHDVLRARNDTQDAGTLVSVVLAAPAIIAFVNGLWHWMARTNQSEVIIKLPDESLITLRNMESADVASAIKALEKLHR